MNKLLIGSLESINLPELGIKDLQVRVDTGAQTSSIHVDHIERVKKNGKQWVAFDLHPDSYNVDATIRCEAPIHDIRRVKSSNGEVQQRYVIKTVMELGDQQWSILITLTDRSDMTYLMLLGREGMSDRVLVDPSQTYLSSTQS
ncbi:MAG: ATP-dependent zinc protease [Gammaproteobacteria bacterium]|nr:ATP-dependent zinc protease [Gammaproteobacteria bacterium]